MLEQLPLQRGPERAIESLENKALRAINDLAQRDYERSLERYGTGVFGKAKAWLNREGERKKAQTLEDAGKFEKTKYRKWMKIGLKTFGGFGLWAGMTFGGGAGALLTPTIWAAGLREGVDGILEAVEHMKWGKKRTELEYKIQLELSATADLLKDAVRANDPDKFERTMQVLQMKESELMLQQNKNMTSERKWKFGRMLGSTAVTLGVGIFGGVSMGIQDYDKGLTPITEKHPLGFLDQAHKVIWKGSGSEFVYNPGEAQHALDVAAEVAKKFGPNAGKLTILQNLLYGQTHVLPGGIGILGKIGLAGGASYLAGRALDNYWPRYKRRKITTVPSREQWEDRGGTVTDKDEEVKKEKDTKLGVSSRVNYFANIDKEFLQGEYPEKIKYKSDAEVADWILANRFIVRFEDMDKTREQLIQVIKKEREHFERQTQKDLAWVSHALEELKAEQGIIEEEIRNIIGNDLPPGYKIEIKWPRPEQIKILGYYGYFGQSNTYMPHSGGMSFIMQGDVMLNGDMIYAIADKDKRMKFLKECLIHEVIHSSGTKNYWKVYQDNNPQMKKYKVRRAGLQVGKVDTMTYRQSRNVGIDFEEGATEELTLRVMRRMFPDYESDVYLGQRQVLYALRDRFGIEEKWFYRAQFDRKMFAKLIKIMEKGDKAVGPYAYVILSDLMTSKPGYALDFLKNCRNAGNPIEISIRHFHSIDLLLLHKVYVSAKWKKYYPGIIIPELEGKPYIPRPLKNNKIEPKKPDDKSENEKNKKKDPENNKDKEKENNPDKDTKKNQDNDNKSEPDQEETDFDDATKKKIKEKIEKWNDVNYGEINNFVRTILEFQLIGVKEKQEEIVKKQKHLLLKNSKKRFDELLVSENEKNFLENVLTAFEYLHDDDFFLWEDRYNKEMTEYKLQKGIKDNNPDAWQKCGYSEIDRLVKNIEGLRVIYDKDSRLNGFVATMLNNFQKQATARADLLVDNDQYMTYMNKITTAIDFLGLDSAKWEKDFIKYYKDNSSKS